VASKPAFGSTRCLDWNDDHWLNTATSCKEPRKKLDMVELELIHRGCQVHPTDDLGPSFDRPVRCLAASLVNANLPKPATFEKINKIAGLMTADVQVAARDLWQEEAVKQIGEKWLTVTGGWKRVKRTLRSLSPNKRWIYSTLAT
jgi:hypothetical protein